MSKEKDCIVLLERLLNQSRQDKLMYLNAADKQDLPTFKRFFNQQALYRNRMFNDFSMRLSDFGIEADNVLLKRPDIRQLMVASPKREKSNPFAKCLAQDQLFKKQLLSLIQIDTSGDSENYNKVLAKIQDSIETNQLYALEVSAKSLTSPDYL
ncbi:MAG: hypothetical protein ACPG7X_04885 [Flavobacteriaceae bacterium]